MTDLLTKNDIVQGTQNFNALNTYIRSSNTNMKLPNGETIKTLKGDRAALTNGLPDNSAAYSQVGAEHNRIPLAQDVYYAANNNIDGYFSEGLAAGKSCNDLGVGTRYLVSTIMSDSPPANLGDIFYFIETRRIYTADINIQTAYGYTTGSIWTRVSSVVSGAQVWSAWVHASATRATYATTTATSANVVVTSTGELQRSTSSKFFKKDIQDIEVADYRQALKAVRPISYRSTADTADNPDHSWYSFIAEELAQLDPRLVQFSDVEFYRDVDDEGNQVTLTRSPEDGKPVPSGINTNAVVALQTKIMQLMLADIEALEKEKTAMKSRLTNIEKRLSALEK